MALGHDFIVQDSVGSSLNRAASEICAERAGLHNQHANAKRPRLVCKRFRETFYGKFSRGVPARTRYTEKAGHRGEIDDIARALPAHNWQHGAGGHRQSKEIHFKLMSKLGVAALLKPALEAIAGIVD